ncbi:peptide ABC transporter [Devosia limi DSM 17137]|uniref:Peptide ABC transporter n=1 Tax=Devosia limi DSM 17137 TaxID=1121477 RepID=A0A0F5LSA7_9HYPH|nr:ABC transporter permease [Devosia limi]KKB85176.1 peptide ABC transporter [Devosia limi DSM 17137]SHF76432.1 peptide/nickel transport system permease protein [Devosia limi DSM 17137]
MRNYLIRRIISVLPVLFFVSLLSFAVIWIIPGDPTAAFLDASATPEQVEALRDNLGLNKPPLLQVTEWYGQVLTGNLGQSILMRTPVLTAILERLPLTLTLAAMALVLAVLLGVAAGVFAATRRGTWADQTVMTLALLGLSVPDFWLGLLLIVVFAVQLGWFPSGGYVPFMQDPAAWLSSMVLPTLTLAVVQIGFIARMTRSAMLDVINQDFIRTAHAKGLSELYVVTRHGLPNAMMPILTVTGIIAGALLGSAVVVEQVFALPGVGRLIIGAILSRDYPLIQGGLLFLTLIYLLINLGVDLLYAAVDPRVRLE